MTRGLVCLMLAACAPRAAPKAPQPITAADILRATAETYAHAKSYADRGTQSDTLATAPPQVETRTFETAFVRDHVLRFEYLRDGDPRRNHVIWATPEQTQRFWYVEPGVVLGTDVITELGAAMGVSGGLSGFVPPLLLHHDELGSVTRLRGATRERDEAIEGHPCWQIAGTQRDFAVTLWIDMETHLIRQIERRYRLKGTIAGDEITRYEPQLDPPLEVARILPPDNHGQPPRPRAEPAWLGVMFDGHNGTTRIQSVVSGGPAEHAGLQPGDVITKIDAAPVSKAAEVVARIRAEKPGTRLHVTVERGGKETAVDVALEKRPDLDDLQGRLVGKPAPDFALAPLTTGSAKLADLKGHVVIVDFWATWCGPCGIAMPHLVELGHRYKDLRIVGISDEDEADIKKYVADHGIDYTIARDADDVVTGHYLVTGLPTLVIVDKAGVVRALHVGAGDFDAIEAEVQRYLK